MRTTRVSHSAMIRTGMLIAALLAVAAVSQAQAGPESGQANTNAASPDPELVDVIPLPEQASESVVRARRRPALEEIVVTAQKREEDLQTVPLSVTAIGGDDLVDKDMGDMNEVASYVPNLDVLAVPTFPSIYMRGLGSSYNRGFEQSVAILIDEVFYGRASYINQGLLDLQSVEVLRGPQGTLFGKNSSAGAIHFRTARPEREFGVTADAQFGVDEHRRFRFASTGPAGDELSWRVALLSDRRDGRVHNTGTGVDEENLDNLGARGRLLWEPGDDLSVDFTVNASIVNQHGSGSQLIEVRDRHLAAMRVFDDRVGDNPYDEETSTDFPAGVARDAWDGTIKIDRTTGGGTVFTSITNYAWLDEVVSLDADVSPVPFLVLDNNESLRQYSQEFRLTSPPGDFEYVAGLYGLRTDLRTTYDITEYLMLNEILQITGELERRACVNSPAPEACQDAVLNDAVSGAVAGQTIQARLALEGGMPQPVETSLTRFDQLTDSLALYGQFTWHFAPRWSATLGGRLNYEKKILDVAHRLLNNRTGQDGNAILSGSQGLPGVGFGIGDSPLGSVIFPVIIAGDTQFQAHRERQDVNLIPKLSAQFDFRDDAMAYASVARGYKSGGFNAQPVNDEQLEFDEEDALTYEIGIKSELLGRAARLNVSLFRTDFDGLQVATFNGFAYVVGNAASATIQGVEFEGVLLTPYGVLLGLNGAFTQAEYDDFSSAPCAAEETGTPPCDLGGQRLRLAPELKTTFTAGWEGSPWRWPVVATAGITASYTSDVPLATDLDPIDYRVPGTTYGVRLGLKSSSGDGWRVTLFGDNVTGHESLAGAQDAPAYRGTHFGGAFPGPSYELEVGYSF